MNRKTVTKNLVANKTWVKNQFNDSDMAQNIMIGCIQVMRQCGKSIEPWVTQKRGRRATLRQIQKLTVRGRNVLTDLIVLTISEIEICIWVDDFWIGALPIKSSKQLTIKHKEAMAQGRIEKANKRKKAKQARFEARLKR